MLNVDTDTETVASAPMAAGEQRLSRPARSHHNINQPTGKNAKELLYLSQLMTNHTPLNSYREHTDTNPELCLTVAGLSNGQRKLCAQHTHVMPAISRGARSALQVSAVAHLCVVNSFCPTLGYVNQFRILHTLIDRDPFGQMPTAVCCHAFGVYNENSCGR